MNLNHPANIMDKDKEKSAVENFLGELGENKEPFEPTPEDPFTKETEVKAEEVEEKEEKPLPFHKDPKVQKFIDKQIAERLAVLSENVGNTIAQAQPVDDEVTDVLTRLIGNDTPEKLSMVKEFKNVLDRGTQRAKAEAIAELELRQNAEVVADQQAEEELENAFENIEETYQVDITSNNPLARKTRQEFVSFVEKIAPKDRNGDIVDYPDMVSAFETFSEIKKSTGTPSRAKELASRGMARSSHAESKPDISKLGFDNIVEHLGIQ